MPISSITLKLTLSVALPAYLFAQLHGSVHVALLPPPPAGKLAPAFSWADILPGPDPADGNEPEPNPETAFRFAPTMVTLSPGVTMVTTLAYVLPKS